MSKGFKHGIGFVIAFVIGCASAPLVVPAISAQPAPPGVQRWEYTCYRDAASLNVDELNRFGSQGWELTGSRDQGGFLCFKRPL